MSTYAYRIRRSLEGCRLRPSLRLCLFESGFCIDIFGFLIALPFLDRWVYEPHEIMESWGPYYFERAVCWTWGDGHWSWYCPWMHEHIKCEVMRPDNSWVPYVGSWEVGEPHETESGIIYINGKAPDGRWEATYPYHYLLLPSGEVQHAQATIYVERREWRQRWLKWCPWFARKRQCISISFDREMGSEAGSWKGGVMGTGYEMRPGEEPQDTLRRMQREHRMDR